MSLAQQDRLEEALAYLLRVRAHSPLYPGLAHHLSAIRPDDFPPNAAAAAAAAAAA